MMEQTNAAFAEVMKCRTRAYALRIIRLHSALPRNSVGRVLADQILRSGTSVGAQFRECIRSRSRAEFISKTESTLQELEETRYWIELIVDAKLQTSNRLASLPKEADELLAILTATVKTAKINRRSKDS